MDPIVGTFTDPVMMNATISSRVFSFDDKVKYAHMSMLEKMAGENGTGIVLVAAWQAAPAVPVDDNGEPRFAVEGLVEQTIMWSLSYDNGVTWTEARAIPTRNAGPVWAPVLHFDASTGKLWLFYAESNKCVKNTNPPTWEPGGDLKAIRCQAVNTAKATAGCSRNSWSVPDIVLSQSEGIDIPKVIANRLIVSKRTKEWILPFWREQSVNGESSCTVNATQTTSAPPAGAVLVDTEDVMLTGTTTTTAPPPPEKVTSSGVAVSRDGGKTWVARGKVTEPRATLIEGSVTDMNPTHVPMHRKQSIQNAGMLSLWMRSGTSCLYRADSNDGGTTWGAPYATKMVNPNTPSSLAVTSPVTIVSSPVP